MRRFEKMPLFARADIIIILLVALLELVSVLFVFGGSSSPEYVCVKLNGIITAEYSLDKTGEYEIIGDNGITLTLVIEKDGVSVKNAECPDKICKKTGKISGAGQSIICLPAKISISLEGGSEEIDAAVG
ncbi:MAG: NusG domain II-containing protein [Acutalibacteraceae bacterium]